VGARTLFAQALVAEFVHGAPSRFADPARFSRAHGRKDGHPFSVPLKVYDETIRVLKMAIGQTKLGEGDRLAAIGRLDKRARVVEVATMTEAELQLRSPRSSRVRFCKRVILLHRTGSIDGRNTRARPKTLECLSSGTSCYSEFQPDATGDLRGRTQAD
jgi:hypothetical protein